jgi:hypothetical protein
MVVKMQAKPARKQRGVVAPFRKIPGMDATVSNENGCSKSSSRDIPPGIACRSGDHFDLDRLDVASGPRRAGIGSAIAVFQPSATSRNGS